ncbi:MAG: GMC family oxidoreductase [Tannerellaceae bacterium]|jgi:choline dehydrogenase-like flavoprotein|nr:GMC family oxidoreductase [Tannerellaceae bacterium]
MDKDKHVQAIVIGAGGGGGVAAKVLATAGMQTVVFERGGWPSYDAHINDELISQRTQALDSAFGPEWDKHPRVYVRENGERDVINAGDGRYNHVAACVGSGTVSYGAMAWRFMREDFRLKTTYGAVEGSTLEDWPVAYEDLEPFYEQAEWEIGVSGDAGPNPFASPRNRPYPMPAFEYNRDGEYLAGVCRRMGLHPFPIPMLRNSVAYNGRAACIRNRTCCGYACPVDAKNGTQNTVIPAAMATGLCRVKTHCVAAELMTDESGRVSGVRYFDPEGKERLQTADVVVVACSAIETARLLLNSRSRLHPGGLGNNHDCVGRNLQGHAYTGASGLFDWDVLDLAGPGATMAICDYNHHNPGIVGGGLLANEFYMMPYAFSQSRPWGEPGWGKSHKDYQRKNYRRLGRMIGPIQEMPMWDARVTVDAEVKDHWGIPVAALSGSKHPLDFEHCRFLSARAEEILKEAGAIRTWRHTGDRPPRSLYGPGGGQHQAGTCRMGNDPATSVVNEWCRVHDVENLFIADGSVLVTNGGFNPVLTIMAMAYRTAGYIADHYR